MNNEAKVPIHSIQPLPLGELHTTERETLTFNACHISPKELLLLYKLKLYYQMKRTAVIYTVAYIETLRTDSTAL